MRARSAQHRNTWLPDSRKKAELRRQLKWEAAVALLSRWKQVTETVIAKCNEMECDNERTDSQPAKETMLGDLRVWVRRQIAVMTVHYEFQGAFDHLKNTARPEHEKDMILRH